MNAADNNMMTLQQAWQWLLPRIPGAQLIGDGALQLGRVHTDSRSLQPGDLFVALKGERFDANDFLADARNSGALAAITTEAEPGQGRQRLLRIGKIQFVQLNVTLRCRVEVAMVIDRQRQAEYRLQPAPGGAPAFDQRQHPAGRKHRPD